GPKASAAGAVAGTDGRACRLPRRSRQRYDLIPQRRAGTGAVTAATSGGERMNASGDTSGGHRERIPRVARLLALAHRFDGLIADGVVANYAELARLGRVSRARISQIMSLLNLSPDLQEAILFMSRSRSGHDPMTLAEWLPVAAELDWSK